MIIAHLLLVGIDDREFENQLDIRGYKIVKAGNTESIIDIDTVFDMMIISQECLRGFKLGDAERLYFMNNSVPTAVLVKSPHILGKQLLEILKEGTFECFYSCEINTGLIYKRIDSFFLKARFDDSIKYLQKEAEGKDVLEKELALREMILSKERRINANILDSITSGIVILDNKGDVVLANEHLSMFIKSKVHEVIGRHYTELFSKNINHVIEELISDNSAGDKKNISVKKTADGEMVLEMSSYSLNDYNSNIIGTILMVRDITEIENINMQLYRSEKLATVGTMLSGIAHELRNPLSIISARVQMALKKGKYTKDSIQATLESVGKQVVRCSAIVNNLLDFTRNTATKKGYHKISEILDETLGYVSYQNLFDDITVKKEYGDNVIVYGDRSRYSQVFLNLITNAAQAMNGRGTITMRSWLKDTGFSEIQICDTGCGIASEERKKIFDPFFTTKSPGEGTGLGLSIVYKIITDSGGKIWFKSIPGETVFYIRLPSTKGKTYG